MLDDIKPRNAIEQSSLTTSDIEKVVNGIYANMQNVAYSFWWDDDIRGENIKQGPGWGLRSDLLLMTPDGDGQVSASGRWNTAFNSINQINFLVESYENSTDKDNASVRSMGCVGYYFRALMYYYLAIHWGNVPIMEHRTYDIIPISKEDKVWEFVEADIQRALALSDTQSSQWYVSTDAINALGARTELFLKKYSEAAAYADKVLQNKSYALAGTSMDFSSIFLPKSTSKEIVFAFVNQTSNPGLNFSDYCNDRDASWAYSPTDEIYSDLYADDNVTNRHGDIRKAATLDATDNTRIIKFSNGVNQLAATTDYTHLPIMVTRISDLYLTKAEALGKTAGAETLHEFLAKRYATAPTVAQIQALSDSDYANLILDERHREFYAEGLWWQDIKRTGRTDLLKTLQGRTYLMYYPIPTQQIRIAGSEAYPQNPGYEQ